MHTTMLIPSFSAKKIKSLDFFFVEQYRQFNFFLRKQLQLIYNCMMISSLSNEYQNDVKPHQSVPAYLDSISSISWATPNIGNVFATTSWDGQLRVLSVEPGQFGNSIFQQYSTKYAYPALKCAWNDQGNQIYVGLLDGSINVLDFGSGQSMEVGRHASVINSLHFITGMNAIISTANDSNAHIWQLGSQSPLLSLNAQNKIFTSDFQYPMLVAGTANEKIMMIDLSNQSSKAIVQSSDLGKGSQIQSIAINQKGTMCGISSHDGRATITNLLKNVSGVITPKTIITFKSNKVESGAITTLYPVNSIAFNPLNDKWFMTAGSDGGLHFWDFQARNKIKSFQYGGSPFCVAKVSPKGDMVAYGLGNDWHLGSGKTDKWQIKLGVHIIAESQMKYVPK